MKRTSGQCCRLYNLLRIGSVPERCLIWHGDGVSWFTLPVASFVLGLMAMAMAI